MKSKLCLAAFAVVLAAAPAAMAQHTYSSTYSGSTGVDQSTTPGMGSSGGTSSDSSVRRTPGQKPVELQQTTLLNQLSAAGYVSVRDFRKEGDRYVASAMDRQGRWTTVILDPHTAATTPTATPAR
ncbi:hypothetical protein A6A40_06890 [Azospirillum humicireducens]|uniref:PepSY domain-containing protein n=1 Tax=Azospirillum humicireducens TaxID=1226968 RepID=A0A160JFI6_9PROT|nr:hypothetical protein [Azospirillum humicireducens]ANC91652.1 hypothetical protein A6A40_06890 [Azospirillum humicireducens]